MARKSAGYLFQRGDMYWLEYQANGKRIRQSLGVTTHKEAERERARIMHPLTLEDEADRRRAVADAVASAEDLARQGLEANRPKLVVADAWAAFAAKPRANSASDKQRAANASRWADFVAYMAATWPSVTTLASVTRPHAEGYLAHLRTHGRFIREQSYRRGRKLVTTPAQFTHLAPGSLNMIQATCRMVFATLAQDAGLTDNPFANIARMKARPIQRDAFTMEEVRELVNRADPFLQPLIITGASTGLRLGDCCTLAWQDLDFTAGGGGMILRQARKTGAAVRIPLLPGFRQYLEARRPAGKPTGPCYPEQAAMYESNPSGISSRVKALISSLDSDRPATEKVPGRDRAVSRRDFHSLRHSFLTLAACAGVPPHLLQQLAGHASPTMTARYTAHENDRLVSAKMAAMPDPLALGSLPGAKPAALPAVVIGTDAERRLDAIRARLASPGDHLPALLADLQRILEA